MIYKRRELLSLSVTLKFTLKESILKFTGFSDGKNFSDIVYLDYYESHRPEAFTGVIYFYLKRRNLL